MPIKNLISRLFTLRHTKQRLKRASNELNKFRLVIDQAPGAVYIVDKEMNFEYINPHFEKMSGYSRDELLNRNIKDTLYKGKLPESRIEIIETLASGNRWQGELLTYTKDGKPYWANTIAAPYKNNEGLVEGYIVIQQDVTERMIMENALKESENLYRTLIESSLDGVILTQDFKFLYFNKVFTDMMGYTFEELMTMNPTLVIAPEDRERIMSYHAQRMEGELLNQSYNARFVRKDGSTFVAEMKATSVEINNKPASLITMRDITEQQKMLDTIALSEQKYRELADFLPQTIYELDVRGNLLYMNKSGMEAFGISEKDYGHSALDSFVPEDRLLMVENLKKTMAGKREKPMNEYTALSRTGKTFPVMIYGVPMQQNGNVVGTRGVIIDISEQKAMENALRESEFKYRSVIDNATDGVVITQKGLLKFVNNALCEMVGYTMDELIEKSFFEIVVQDDHQIMIDYHKRRMAGEDFNALYRSRLIHKSGEIITVEINSRTSDYKGESAAFIIVRDVTESVVLEKALQESESKYKALVENSQDGISIVRDNKYLYANQTYCNRLGYTLEELLKMPSHLTIHPDDRAKALELGERRRNLDNSTINEVFRLLTKSGEVRECETSSTMIEYGGVWASFFTSQDITESKRMQDALAQSEEKYRLLFEAESDAIFMVDVESGEILDVNPAATRIYGYSRNEFLQMKNTDVSAEPEKTHEATKRNDAKVLVRFHIKKDQTIFPVELSAGFTDFKGRKIQIVTSRDITENKKMQDALTESEQRFRELADLLPQTIYELDLKGRITFMNQAGIKSFGKELPDQELTALNFIVQEDHPRLINNIKLSIENNNYSVGNEYTAIRADGTQYPILVYGAPAYKNGVQVGSRGIIIDISERKAAEKAISESEEKYRELVEKTNAIILKWDNRGKITFLNDYGQKFFGYTLDEIVGKDMIRTIVPDVETYSDRDLSLMLNEIIDFPEKYEHNVNENIRKNGERVWISWNNSSIRNKQGHVEGISSIGTDITRRIIVEKELQIAKDELEMLNKDLESRVIESSQKLAETRTQLINLQKENLQSQFEVLRQQVNPHFLFNSLNVLTSLIKLEPDLAEQFSEHLSKVYRYVLENKDNELVDLHTELRFLDAYIFLLNIRFIDKIKVNINIPEEKRTWLIIPLAMQLLIENAIKHNIMTKTDPLNIEIFIDKSDYLNIINNLQERPSQLVSTGVGLKNIQNRYLLLNNTQPVFEKTETHFVAKVPLVIN